MRSWRKHQDRLPLLHHLAESPTAATAWEDEMDKGGKPAVAPAVTAAQTMKGHTYGDPDGIGVCVQSCTVTSWCGRRRRIQAFISPLVMSAQQHGPQTLIEISVILGSH